jgi:hypothetical protein
VDTAYPELTAISRTKPLAVLEFGVVDDARTGDKGEWIGRRLASHSGRKVSRIKAISYWHESWVMTAQSPISGWIPHAVLSTVFAM